MSAKPRNKGVRAVPARIVELREEIAEREGRLLARIEALEQRDIDRNELARELAHACGVAIATTIRNHPR